MPPLTFWSISSSVLDLRIRINRDNPVLIPDEDPTSGYVQPHTGGDPGRKFPEQFTIPDAQGEDVSMLGEENELIFDEDWRAENKVKGAAFDIVLP